MGSNKQQKRGVGLFQIKQLPGNKATVSKDVPVSVLKEFVSAYYKKLIDIFNNCMRSIFQKYLKNLK